MILSCTYWNDRHGFVAAPQPAASVPWPETHARLTSAFAGAAFRVKATKAAMVCEVLDIMDSQVLRRGNERRTGAQIGRLPLAVALRTFGSRKRLAYGFPTGAAFALKMRPTTTPSASTS